jgi:hypothetical protein
MVSAWPEPPFATPAEWSAGVPDGTQAFALGTIEHHRTWPLGSFRAAFCFQCADRGIGQKAVPALEPALDQPPNGFRPSESVSRAHRPTPRAIERVSRTGIVLLNCCPFSRRLFFPIVCFLRMCCITRQFGHSNCATDLPGMHAAAKVDPALQRPAQARRGGIR